MDTTKINGRRLNELDDDELDQVTGGGLLKGGSCPKCGSDDLYVIGNVEREDNTNKYTLAIYCNGCKSTLRFDEINA